MPTNKSHRFIFITFITRNNCLNNCLNILKQSPVYYLYQQRFLVWLKQLIFCLSLIFKKLMNRLVPELCNILNFLKENPSNNFLRIQIVHHQQNQWREKFRNRIFQTVLKCEGIFSWHCSKWAPNLQILWDQDVLIMIHNKHKHYLQHGTNACHVWLKTHVLAAEVHKTCSTPVTDHLVSLCRTSHL